MVCQPRRLACAVALALAVTVQAHQPPASQPATDASVLEALKDLRTRLDELEERHAREKETYEATIAELRGELDQLRATLGAQAQKPPTGEQKPPPGAPAADELAALLEQLNEQQATPTAETPSFTERLGRAFQSFNPDISVIGDFVGHYSSREGGEFDDKFLFRELELGFSGALDPYARADVFLGIHRHEGDYHLHVEEAYMTYLGMPWGLQPRVGKFRSSFGRANPLHLHALPWVEYPLVIQNYFGEEGLSGEGIGVSWLVPNRWDKYIELTYEITNNDSSLFAGNEADDFVHLAHVKTFWDLSDASSLEAGASFAIAPNDKGHEGNLTLVEGVDLTYKWRPPATGLYKSLLWQTELLMAQADLRGGQEKTWGAYTALDYQFARRWSIGTRYDYSQMPYNSSLHEHGPSVYLTFMQSEYVYWRLAYEFTDRNFRIDNNQRDHEIFLQCNFGLGPHRAHKY